MSDEEAARTQETIERQQREIDDLRRRLEGERFAEDLRDTLILAATAGAIGSPVASQRLLELILRTAATVIGTPAGSVFSVRERTEELHVEVAIGPHAEEMRDVRVPLGQGIAGLVVVSGQPMAVSNADEDPRVLREIGERIGYRPTTLLAVPLVARERVVGVMELLDKTEGAFTARDMDVLRDFADEAGLAIELTRTYKRLGPLISDVIQGLEATPGTSRERLDSLRRRTETFVVAIEEEPSYLETMELATLVQQISWEGDAELKACQKILRGFADYLRSRPDPFEGAS